MAVWQVRDRLDPFPALCGQFCGHGLELCRHHLIQKSRVLQPTAVIALEKIAQDHPARGLVSIKTYKLSTLIIGLDGAFGELTTDLIGFFRPTGLDGRPDLLLTGMIGTDAEGHQLIKAHGLIGIGLKQDGRYMGQTKPLLDDIDPDKKACGDVFFRSALFAKGLKGTKLVQWVQANTLDVFSEGIFFGACVRIMKANDARYGRAFRQPLLLD